MTAKAKHNPSTPAPAPAEPSAAPETEIEQLKSQVAENWDKFLRATAELENYRKRVAREREELVRVTSERVVLALLPVLDNLERALAAANETTPLVEGVQQIHAQFRRTLEEFGLKEVATEAGHAFDPNIHEAVGHIASADYPEGHVIEQLQRGYKMADRLLRPARVVVSKGAPGTDDTPAQ